MNSKATSFILKLLFICLFIAKTSELLLSEVASVQSSFSYKNICFYSLLKNTNDLTLASPFFESQHVRPMEI
jgi:hypothetical protein